MVIGVRRSGPAHPPVRTGVALLFVGVVVVLLAACAGRSQAPREPDGVRVLRGWTYATADGRPLRLDLYLPEIYERPLPIVVWLHGGGWMFGSRDGCPLAVLAQRGYAVASVDYRLSTPLAPVAFPAQLHDCKAAVRWLRTAAWRFGCDGARIGVVGVSAGGHLAALLGTTADEPALDGDLGGTGCPSRVQAVVALFPPSDLLALEARDADHWRVKLVALGLLDGRPSARPQLARDASPALHADRDSAPFLIFHGRDDGMVPVDQGERLHAALAAAGAASRLVVYDHLPHSDEALDRAELQADLQEFLAGHLHPPPPVVVGR